MGIAGSSLLSQSTGVGFGVVAAVFLSGGLATIASGFLMFGTRNVKDPHQAEVASGDSSAARVR